ncbi:hypothetical protein ACVBGC_00170 [Burkholderia stagnalis]
MRTQDIRLDAGQNHLAWFDKGSQVIVLDGTVVVTLHRGGLDWLPEAPRHIRRTLAEGECLTIDTAGHVALTASGPGAVRTTVVAPAGRGRVPAMWRTLLRRWSARILANLHVRERERS